MRDTTALDALDAIDALLLRATAKDPDSVFVEHLRRLKTRLVLHPEETVDVERRLDKLAKLVQEDK